MSTIDTQLNWGASLVVNDLWRRFVTPEADEVHQMRASRAAVVGLAVLGGVVSFLIHDIGIAWKLAISVTAGLGTVYMARWYWWRVNAWSELSAMVVAGLCTWLFAVLAAHHPAGSDEPWQVLASVPEAWLSFPFSTAATVALSLPIWVAVTLLSPPVERAHLLAFYERVRPGGLGWRAVASDLPGFEGDGPTRYTFLGIISGVVAVYSVLLAVGGAVTGDWLHTAGFAVLALVGGAVAGRQVAREVAP